eukprot:gene5447-10941_t
MEIAKGIYLFTTRRTEPIEFSYEVENTSFKNLSFSLVFDGSVNFEVDGVVGMQMSCHASPYRRTTVGSLKLLDPSKRGIIKCNYSWHYETFELDDVLTYYTRENTRLNENLEKSKQINECIISQQNRDLIEKNCFRHNMKFIDTSFPPLKTSLYNVNDEVYTSNTIKLPPKINEDFIIWKRPCDYIIGPFSIFPTDISNCQMRLGELSSVSFISTMSCFLQKSHWHHIENCFMSSSSNINNVQLSNTTTITTHHHHHHHSIPHELTDVATATTTISAAGVYEVRLFENGCVERVVVIDDMVPCAAVPGGGPVGTKTLSNDIWIILLEKAMAKVVFAFYSALHALQPHEIMATITGCPCIHKPLKSDDDDIIETLKNGVLWSSLLRMFQMGGFMTATSTSTGPTSDGTGTSQYQYQYQYQYKYKPLAKQMEKRRKAKAFFLRDYSYGVTAMREIGNLRLVRIRNPWKPMDGDLDWDGVLAEDSPLWTDTLKLQLHGASGEAEAYGATETGVDVDVGVDVSSSLWLTLEELCEHFDAVNVCATTVTVTGVGLGIGSGSGGSYLSQFPSLNVLNRNTTTGCSPWYRTQRRIALSYDIQQRLSSCPVMSCPVLGFTVRNSCEVYIGAHQVSEYANCRKSFTDLGVVLFRVCSDRSLETVAGIGVAKERDRVIETSLGPGRYVLQCISSGYYIGEDLKIEYKQQEKEEGAMTNKRQHHNQKQIRILNENGTNFNGIALDAIRDMFNTLDTDMDGLLNRSELSAFLRMSEGCELEDEKYDWLIQNFEAVNGGLTIDGLTQVYMFMVQACGGDTNVLLRDLTYMGFDSNMKRPGHRSVIVNIHRVIPHDTAVSRAASELSIA